VALVPPSTPPPVIIEFFPVVGDRVADQHIPVTTAVTVVDFPCTLLRQRTAVVNDFIEVRPSENYLKYALWRMILGSVNKTHCTRFYFSYRFSTSQQTSASYKLLYSS
jgi:hypothetical protein